jgi:uncharacterized protein (PEP-CTERM system associated)
VAGALAFVAFDAPAQYAVPAPPLLGEPAAAPAPATTTANAPARTPPLQASLATDFEFTDNVNLAPSGQRQSDFVTQITPSLKVNEKGAHTSLQGTIAAPILLYARTGNENNAVQPNVNLTGTAELYPRLFYLDGSVQVSQQYFNPFGARPQDLASATNNRYTAQSYRVSPYLKGDASGGLHYELRDNNIWSNANSAPVSTDRSYTNEIVGNVTRDPRPFGWSFDYDRSDTRFKLQDPLLTETERAHASWRANGQLELSGDAGYEHNTFTLQSFSGVVYGVAAKWHPTDRTDVEASWEHRFFGASYHVTFDHRTPLSVWSLRASRDITTYPQQLATLEAGRDVGTLLNQLFTSQFTDPAQRQTFVDQLIRDRGLPAVLSSPLTLYSQQVTLQETAQGTVGLLGARNAVFLTAYRTRNEPIGDVSRSVADLLSNALNDNTQTGTNIIWTHKLTALYVLTTSADWARTVGNGDVVGSSNQVTFRSMVSAPLSLLTTVYAGARYQRLTSDIGGDYHESAFLVGISHIFR